jgi:hypothetical protein
MKSYPISKLNIISLFTNIVKNIVFYKKTQGINTFLIVPST